MDADENENRSQKKDDEVVYFENIYADIKAKLVKRESYRLTNRVYP